MKIITLMGGPSPEREISIKSGQAVSDGLKRLGHDVLDEDFSIETFGSIIREKPDVVFLIMHGSPGEDGTVQGILEILGVPYTGSGVRASSLSIDKAALKRFLSGSDISMPPWFLVLPSVTADITRNRIAAQGMVYPVIVKPTSAGSTIGISIVRKEDELEKAIIDARKINSNVMIEQFINGREITVSIVGNEDPIILPTQEIVAEGGFYNYDAKYTPGKSEHIFSPDIDSASIYKAEEMAERAYIETGCRGFARADFIVGLDGEPYFLEMNTIPGMTEISLVPDSAREYGWSFDELLKRIVEYALESYTPVYSPD